MRRLSKDESRARFAEARDLWNRFNPIGVPSLPLDEYENYVGPSLRIAEAGLGPEDILEYVSKIVFGHMGLSRGPDIEEKITAFSCDFYQWYGEKWRGTHV